MQPRTLAAILLAALACGATAWWRCASAETTSTLHVARAEQATVAHQNEATPAKFLPAAPAVPTSAEVMQVRATAAGRTNAPEVTPETWAELALRTFDPVKRTVALSAALRTWSASDPGAALVWLSSHPEEETAFLVQSIGEGSAQEPGQAIPFALTYLAQDRELGALLAGALVRTLAERGETDSAVQLAHAAPEGWEHQWTAVAFTNLAYEDAATALEQLHAATDPALRRTMAGAIIAGWAERDPVELAAHADDAFENSELRNAARELALAKAQERVNAAHDAAASRANPRS